MTNQSESDNTLSELYRVALRTYTYIHADVWRGQKYYTTLNIAIITIAFSILGVEKTSNIPQWVAIPLFVIGLTTSLFGYWTIIQLRKNFLNVICYKTIIERASKNRLESVKQRTGVKNEEWKMTPFYQLKENEIEKILEDPQRWVRQAIWRRGGVTYLFIVLQLVFFSINALGTLLTIYLSCTRCFLIVVAICVTAYVVHRLLLHRTNPQSPWH